MTATAPIDKTAWGPGPWQDEPDYEAGVLTTASGTLRLPYTILRVENMGHLCGYLGLPPEHEHDGTGYDDIPAHAHGGLTFARRNEGENLEFFPNIPPGWWIVGFDCAHAGDLTPGIAHTLRHFLDAMQHLEMPYDTYRTIAYVREELQRLADQLG